MILTRSNNDPWLTAYISRFSSAPSVRRKSQWLTLSDDICPGCSRAIEKSSDMAIIVRIEINAAFEVVDVITPYICLS
jgi:hypothetical protein